MIEVQNQLEIKPENGLKKIKAKSQACDYHKTNKN